MKSKRYTIIGIVAIVSLIFFVVVTFCGKGHQWSNNVVQGFKTLGLKGNVKVIGTYKEIEAFHGTVVEVNYTERFSDGYFLDENLRADIREYNGEHISDFYPPLSTKIEALLNDKEKDLFDTVKFNEFSFLLDVYKMRQGFQLEEDEIKNIINFYMLDFTMGWFKTQQKEFLKFHGQAGRKGRKFCSTRQYNFFES